MTRKVLILADEKYLWNEEDIELFIEMWNTAESHEEMSRVFKCKTLDIYLLALDQIKKNKIQSRTRGIL